LTYHSIVRYLERIKKIDLSLIKNHFKKERDIVSYLVRYRYIDLQRIKKEMVSKENKKIIIKLESCSIPLKKRSKNKLKIRNKHVVTVI
jgi:hypothetical protein